MASRLEAGASAADWVRQRLTRFIQDERLRSIVERIVVALHDAWWYVTRNPRTLVYAAGAMVVIMLLYLGNFLISGRIYPNVSTMGVSVGGQSVDNAATMLRETWASDVMIDIVVEGDIYTSASPEEIGLTLDAESTARAARDAGLRGVPFGHEVMPIVELDYSTAQNYLLELAEVLEFPPSNASYVWSNGEIAGLPGQTGRILNTNLSLEQMVQHTGEIARDGRFELLVTPLLPDVVDPDIYAEDVAELLDGSLMLIGYDPFSNQRFTWPIDTETYAGWLEAGARSLTLREENFLPYVDALNTTLNPNGSNERYLSPTETLDHMRDAIQTGSETVNLRIRYRHSVHEVASGDTMSSIARGYGVPLFMLLDANTGINPDILSIGDEVIVPTRDVTMENDPVPEKRIVVDLDRQYLVAFENGQVLFEWPISSGVSNAPTSPGIYQILSHEEVAYGSSSTLCNSAGLECGVWEMNWFMGIYRVQPQLVNGFHGSVLLPNGGLLGGGAIGRPNTFGCVMSNDEDARALYEWAEIGTVVEIVSTEFQPMSDLGWAVWNQEWRGIAQIGTHAG